MSSSEVIPSAPETPGPSKPKTIFTMQEWIDMELTGKDQEVVFGSPANPLVRPRTKNLLEAPEKSFKTTVLLRLMGGLSCGHTVYPSLPVTRARRVLYLHGELSNAEIKARTIAASAELPEPYSNLHQGRTLNAHLIEKSGQKELRHVIADVLPDEVVLDPWQSFIDGHDENSFKDMSAATGFCNDLIEEFGVTLWIPIHLGKDRSRGARGHSTIAGWRDTRIQLRREGDTVEIEVEPRWATAPKPFRLRFRNGTMWPDGDVVSGQTAVIRAFVEKNGGVLAKPKLYEYLGKSEDACRKALERAEEAGAVSAKGDYVLLPELSGTANDGGSVM